MGVIVYVFRNNALGDCTRQGISSRFDRLCVVNVPGSSEPSEDCPAVILQQHVRGALRIVPVDYQEHHYCNGGNYAGSSNGIFGKACKELLGHSFYGAVAIHDRDEHKLLD